MKIELNKAEFAIMLSRCVDKCPGTCCPLYDRCQTDYIGALTEIITIIETENSNGKGK